VEARLLRSIPLFELSRQLVADLRAYRDARGRDDFSGEHDAFLLDPGLGPPTYLTTDGRILWQDDGWGIRGTRADAFVSICAGIRKTGVGRLRELLPQRRADAVNCERCRATGRFDSDGALVDAAGRRCSLICMTCGGLGWRAPSLPLDEVVLDAG
jgi:hypothetical protein